jgi:hypothetical protein
MSGTEQEVMPTEDELWDAALSGEAPKVESAPEPTGTTEPAVEPEPTRERDEHGRFKATSQQETEPKVEAEPEPQEPPANAATPEPTAAAPPVKEEHESIPPWRLREIREARDVERTRAEKAEADAQNARRQIEQSQRQIEAIQKELDALKAPKKEPVNLFEQPDAFVGSIEQRLTDWEKNWDARERRLRLEQNLAIAAVIHKDEFQPAYDAFVKAAENDPGVRSRVFSSTDPGGAIVAWHREQRTLSEIGTDPTAYVQKKLDEALKDPAFLAKALEAARAQASGQPAPSQAPAPGQPAPRPNNVTQLPPSLRTMPGTAASSDGTGIQHMSEEDLFNAALRR